MPARYYLAPIIGDGSTAATAYRAKVPAGVEFSNVIPSNATGHPLFTWTLVLVNAPSLATTDADITLTALPAIARSAALSTALTAPQVAALFSALNTRGISTTGLSGSSTLGQVLARIGTTLDSGFQLTAIGRPGVGQ